MSGKNIFAALQKKKSSKKPAAVKDDVPEEERVDKHAELEKAIFSAPTGGMSNWADDSEEEWEANAHDHPAAAEEGWNQVTSYRNTQCPCYNDLNGIFYRLHMLIIPSIFICRQLPRE